MNFINVNVEDFIPICFRRSIYEEIYQSIIFPVNGEVLWKRTHYPDVHPPHKMILIEDFIPICFRRSIYEEIYQSIIFPVNGEVLWKRTHYPDVHPPHKMILPRRPKKKRRLKE